MDRYPYIGGIEYFKRNGTRASAQLASSVNDCRPRHSSGTQCSVSRTMQRKPKGWKRRR